MVEPAIAPTLSPELARELLVQMVRIREFEQTAYLRFLQGEIPGTLHQSQGQEAVAVGVCSLLTKDDWITSTHRPHGHALAKGMHPNVAMAEVYGKSTGCLGGRGGSMHLGDPDIGMLTSTAIVGGGLTIAPGLAWALKSIGTKNVAVSFFGDGASNEGAFHEGVNYAAAFSLPVIFVCENNMYGASTPFHEVTKNTNVASRGAAYGIPSIQVDGMDVLAVRDAMTEAVERARNGEGPTLIEALTYRFVGHSRNDARAYRTKDEEQLWKDRDPIESLKNVVSTNGILSDSEIESALAQAKQEIADAVLFAQESPVPDATAATDLLTIYSNLPDPSAPPIRLPDGPEERWLSISEALREGIAEEMRANPAVYLLGEDVGVPGGFGGAFGVYLGLSDEFGRDRVVDTPISEKAILGAAIGSGIAGMRPLADLQYADFIYEAMDEIVNEAAKIRYMSGGKVAVPMVLRSPVGASQRGAQHSQCPESQLLNFPGLRVVCVSDPYVAKGVIKTALRGTDPVLIFEHKKLYGSKKRVEAGSITSRTFVPEEDYTIPLGKALIRRDGTDVTILATFTELYKSLEIAARLAAEGISCEVIDPVWLSPFDWETIFASVRKTGRLVVAHEGHLTGGWGGEVAARVAEECFSSLRAPIKRVASKDVPMPFAPSLESAIVPAAADIEKAIRDVVA